MPGTVQWSNNPVPPTPSTPGGNTFTSYGPDIRMTTYNDPLFVSPVSAKVADNITYATSASGYTSNDPAWPQSEAGIAHNFRVKFKGKINIESNNTYEIYIMATDTVYLEVDGNRIVNVTGSHGASACQGQTYLETGLHDLIVGYQNYNSDAVIGELFIQEGLNVTIACRACSTWKAVTRERLR